MKLIICLFAYLVLVTVNNADAVPITKIKNSSHLYTVHYENVLGTSMELKIYAASAKEAANAETAATNEISRMAKILSAYDANSEFSKWLATSKIPVHISPELFEVLQLFDQWRTWSGGALDASAEVIGRLWKQAATKQQVPTKGQLEQAVKEIQQQHWMLDAANQTAAHLSNAPLMLNSFAKSYIIQHAARAAMASGKVNSLVVNIGGDLVVAGKLTEPVVISDPKNDAENAVPLSKLSINNKAVATSGNYRRGELIGGHWYSHIVDPRTGLPADNIISATVVAPNATDAGALATAFNVMTPEESMQLANKVPGAEYLIITADGKRIESKGWKLMEASVINSVHPQHATQIIKSTTSKNDFELVVNLEINLQKEGFVKRPYVAVWVEDENHAAVRTIALWHERDRYLPELKSWFMKYRGVYNSDKNIFSTVSSATRSAGKYTVKWDRKDDKGNELTPGKYTIKIEAAREHGTYQLMRQEIICDETPKQISIAGNVEIAAASLDYRKKTSGN